MNNFINMEIKKSKNTISVSPFAKILLKGISLIILIFTRTENIYGKTSIKQLSFDLVSESVPNILCLLAIEKYKDPTLFYLIVSKNLYFKYNGKRITIKLFSREIGYRASYNYKIQENEIAIFVDDLNLKNLELTHDHVYDLLSISYGGEYKIKGSSINWYTHVNIGFSINFPGEFYCRYLMVPPINLKKVRKSILERLSFTESSFRVYDQCISAKLPKKGTECYYNAVFNSTSSYQWAINILIGLIENIFIEYVVEMPVCSFLAIYPLNIHISIGTILGTIEWLYRYFKEEDKSGFLEYFYALFCMQSVCILKIGYYN